MSVGRSGCGTAHASYITRMTALDPEGRETAGSTWEERLESPSLVAHEDAETGDSRPKETLENNLNDRSLDGGEEHAGGSEPDVDPVWTWNAPQFLTGDRYGTRPELGESSTPERL